MRNAAVVGLVSGVGAVAIVDTMGTPGVVTYIASSSMWYFSTSRLALLTPPAGTIVSTSLASFSLLVLCPYIWGRENGAEA